MSEQQPQSIWRWAREHSDDTRRTLRHGWIWFLGFIAVIATAIVLSILIPQHGLISSLDTTGIVIIGSALGWHCFRHVLDALFALDDHRKGERQRGHAQ